MELQDKLVENLSGGERKRLGLAASLVRKPDVILMDEVRRIARRVLLDVITWCRTHTHTAVHPLHITTSQPTNHMDVEAIEWLEDHLRQRQVTAIVVTHDRCGIKQKKRNPTLPYCTPCPYS